MRLLIAALLCVASNVPVLAGTQFSKGPYYCWSNEPALTDGQMGSCRNELYPSGIETYACDFSVKRNGKRQTYLGAMSIVLDPAAMEVQGRKAPRFTYEGITCEYHLPQAVSASTCAYHSGAGTCLFVEQGIPKRGDFQIIRHPNARQ